MKNLTRKVQMSKAITAIVKEVRWFTTEVGFVKPVVVLNKMYKRHGVEFDSLGIANAGVVNDLGLKPDVTVKITVNKKDKSLKVKESDNSGGTIFPSGCPVCGSELVKATEQDLFCTGEYCTAKSRTPIVKLALMAFDDTEFSVPAIYKYLETFPIKGSNSKFPITSILQFIQSFSDAGAKDTNVRDETLRNVYGDFYEAAKEIESKFTTILKKGLNPHEFWYVANIRNVSLEEIKTLGAIDFSVLARQDFETQLANLDISRESKITVGVNKPYLYQLRKFLNAIRLK
jgi:hypothetical protein